MTSDYLDTSVLPEHDVTLPGLDTSVLYLSAENADDDNDDDLSDQNETE